MDCISLLCFLRYKQLRPLGIPYPQKMSRQLMFCLWDFLSRKILIQFLVQGILSVFTSLCFDVTLWHHYRCLALCHVRHRTLGKGIDARHRAPKLSIDVPRSTRMIWRDFLTSPPVAIILFRGFFFL